MHYDYWIGKQKEKGEQTRKFFEFIKQVVERILNYSVLRYPQFLIADNASSHKKDMINEWIEQQGYEHIYLPLPPHSPTLNPIEQAWSIWKNIAKYLYFESNEDVIKEIQSSSSIITIAICARIFAKIQRHIWPQCINKQPQYKSYNISV